MKKTLDCLLVLIVILGLMLTACGGQETDGAGSSAGLNGGAQLAGTGMESSEEPQNQSEDDEIRAVKFEISDAAKEALQAMIDKDEKSAEKVFWIEPVRC